MFTAILPFPFILISIGIGLFSTAMFKTIEPGSCIDQSVVRAIVPVPELALSVVQVVTVDTLIYISQASKLNNLQNITAK